MDNEKTVTSVLRELINHNGAKKIFMALAMTLDDLALDVIEKKRILLGKNFLFASQALNQITAQMSDERQFVKPGV